MGLRSPRAVFSFVTLGVLLGDASAAYAGSGEIQRGIDYLSSVQDPDGSFSLTRGSLVLRDTAEVVTALNALGLANDPHAQAAASYLRIANVQTGDFSARVIGALRLDPLIDTAATALLQSQLTDGGFSLAAGFAHGDVLDTALAMMALEPELKQHPDSLFAAVGFLSLAQSPDGGFGPEDDGSDVITTAQVIRALGRFRSVFDLSAQLAAAQAYLLSLQLSDGSFGASRPTALAILALSESGQDSLAAVTNAINALELQQESAGGFSGGDPEVTALALQALRLSLPNLKLAATDVSFSTTDPAAGSHVTITVTVRNLGAQAAGSSVVRVYRGDGTTVAVSGTAPSLAAGASAPVVLDFDTTGLDGSQVLNVVVDATNLIAESREDDNSQRYAINVHPHRPVDLEVSANDLVFSPERPQAEQATTFALTVHNLGDDAAGAFVVRFYDGDPTHGAPLVAEASVSGIAAQGSAAVSIGPNNYVAPPHVITALVNPTGAISETRSDNNTAVKALVVAANIDLVLTSDDITLTPANPIHVGSSTQIAVRLTNTGGDTFANAKARLYIGDPTQGGTAIGDISVGDLAGGTSRTGTFNYNVGNVAGAFLLYAVADPDQTVDEISERNNTARVPLTVTGGPDAKFYSATTNGGTFSEGDSVQVGFIFGNAGDQPITSEVVRFFDGDPASGGRKLGDVAVPLPNANPPGQPLVRNVLWNVLTLGMTTGTHVIYAVADPDQLIAESDRTNNTGSSSFTLVPRPDPGVVLSDMTVTPDTPEQGDQITLRAIVRDYAAPNDIVQNAPHVQLYLGDPATGGTLLLDQQVTFLGGNNSPPVTLTSTLSTSNLIGPQTFVCLIDPQRLVKDGNRVNNRADLPFTISPPSKPDFTVAQSDLSTTPSPVPAETSVTVRANARNLRAVAATGVHVSFYDGDPATGGPLLADQTVTLPANGQAVATASLDTHGVLGDIAVFTKVDPANAIVETNENNNEAYLPIEVRHPSSTAPTNLTTSLSGGNTVNLAWSAASLSPQRGYYVARDGTVLGTTTNVAGSSTITATTTRAGRTTAQSVDGNVNTSWYPDSNDASPQITFTLSRKEYVSSVQVTWDIAAAAWTLDAWDGVQFNTIASGPKASNLATTTINIATPLKTRKLRLSAGQSGIEEMKIFAIAPTTALISQDASRPAGTSTYTVTAVDTDGIETMPAVADATIAVPDPPTGLSAAVAANDVTLSWTSSTSATALGTMIRRDGKVVSATAGITAQATLSESSESSVSFTKSNAADGNLSTFWQPATGDNAAFLEADFSQKHLVARVDLGWSSSGKDARDFDIQTWDGSSFVTRLSIRNHGVNANTPQTEHFDLPDLQYTDRVRVNFLAFNGSVLNVGELDIREVSPIANATTSFVDHSLRTGNYAYVANAVNSFGQISDSIASIATVNALSAPTNLAAAASGSNVALTWTNGTEANRAGTYVWRNGLLGNAVSSTNIAGRGTITISSDPAHSAFLNDAQTFPTISESAATQSFTVELVLPRSEIVSKVVGGFSGSNVMTFTLQTWDGTQYVNQWQQTQVSQFFTPTFTLPSPVRTTRVRWVFPVQGTTFQFNEFQIFGAAPVTGTSFTDSAPPLGNDKYEVSADSVLDDEGARSTPAFFQSGTVSQPQNLVATLSGRDVILTWTQNTDANATGYHVYRDSTLISGLIAKNTPTFTDPTRPNGTYTYWATTVSNTNTETIPSNTVTVNLSDSTPPGAPPNLRVTPNGSNIVVAWDAPAAAGIAGYHLYKDHAATPVGGQMILGTSFVDTYVRGQPAYFYEVSAVDTSANESAHSSAAYSVAAPTAPTNVQTTTSGTDVTVNLSVSTGVPDILIYRYARDGQYLLESQRAFSGLSTTPPRLAGSSYDPGNITDEVDNSYWVSDENVYPIVLEQSSGAPLPIDKFRVLFADAGHVASDFDVSVLTFGGWVNIAQVRSNTALEVAQLTSDPPPIATGVRLTILAGPAPAVALADFRVIKAIESGPPFTDHNVPTGPHTYTARGENRSGVFSPYSTGASGTVSGIDLVIGPSDIHFTQQTVAVGDTIGISAVAHNNGIQDVDTDVSIYGADPAGGAPALASQAVHIPAGATAEVLTTWTIPSGALNVYAVVDKNNLLPELDKSNNKSFRGLPFDLPYKSLAYTPEAFFLSIYNDNTHVLVRNSSGQNVASLSGNRGQILTVPSLAKGGYSISGDQKFASAWGGTFNNQPLPATGYYVLDQENRSYSTEFYFVGAFGNPGDDRVIVFGRDPNTTVTVTNAQTAALLGQASLQPGDHLRLTGTASQPIHVVANNPVAVVNFADNGYPVPATSGKYSGTHFYVFVGQLAAMDLNVLSYQDNTSYTIRDLTTGVIFGQGTLANSGIASQSVAGGTEHYYEVTTSNTVGVTVRPYDLSTFTYAEGSPYQDRGGTLIGTDFLDTIQGRGVGGTPSAVLMAYYDNTIVTVQQVATNPPIPPAQLAMFRYNLNGGDFVSYGPGPVPGVQTVNGQPGLNSCTGGSCPAILYRLTSTRPISSVSGTIDNGNGAGGPAPLLFAAANAPDLTVLASSIQLSPAQPDDGQNVTVTARIANLGPLAADSFYVAVYDNAPEQGGKLLHEEFVAELVEGDDYPISGNWVAEPGQHQITVIADSRAQVAEVDETNNRGFVLAQTRPDLVIAATDLTLVPSSVFARQPATLTATVHNTGGRPATAPLAVYAGDPTAGGRELMRQNVTVLAGGSSQATFTVDTSGLVVGPQSLYVKADPDNTVIESSESNNTAAILLTVNEAARPDPAVVSVSPPPSVSVAQDVSVSVAVDNFGAPLVGSVALRLYDGAPEAGGVAIGTQTITLTGPKTVSFNWVGPRASGDHTLVAIIDPDNQVAEEDETNNRAQAITTASVSAATLAVSTDHPSYSPGATAQLATTVFVPSGGDTLTLQVHDSAGALVATLIDAQPAATGLVLSTLPITGLLPGAYSADAFLAQGGTVLVRASAAFQVTSDAALLASLASDHLTYAPDGTVQLIGTVANPGTNDSLHQLDLQFSIVDSASATIGQATLSVDAVPPGGRAQRVAAISVGTHAATTATATLEVRQAGTLLATATATFQITTDPRVAGSISATPNALARGQIVTVSRSLQAVGNTDASGNLVTSVLDPMTGATLLSVSEAISLPAGGTFTGSTTIDTSPLIPAPYIITVDLVAGTTRLFRGIAGFEVIDTLPPVITISGVSDGQCANGPLQPTVTAVDPEGSAFTLTITLDGQPFTSGTTVSAAGSHTLAATAVDSFGHQSQKSVSFILDTTAPSVTVSGVSEGQVSNVPLSPTFSASDANLTSTSATLDGQPFTSGTAVSAEGAHTLIVEAVDCAGHTGSSTVHFTIDTTPPAVTVSGVSANQCVEGSFTPTFSATDATALTVTATLDGNTFVSGSTVSTEGTHLLVVTATDAAGNTTSVQPSFIIDDTSPAIAVTGVSQGLITTQAVTPTITITEANLTSSSITLDGVPFVSGTTINSEADHVLQVVATDCAGHTTTRQISFAIDRTAPSVAISGVSANQCGASSVTPTISISDAHLASQSITLNGGSFVSGTAITANGSYELAASATDGAGNQTSRVVDFVIDSHAPTITVSGVTNNSYVNTNVTPTITISDTNLTSQSIQLDGSAFTSGTTVSTEATHTLQVDASDCAGNNAGTTVTFTIDKTAPVISLSGVADGQTYVSPVTPVFSGSDAHLSSVTATLDGASFTSGTTVSSNAAHTLVITALDTAGNQAQLTVHFTINGSVGTISINRTGKPRILIAIDCQTDSGDPNLDMGAADASATDPDCGATYPTFLQGTLGDNGYWYDTVVGRTNWVNALRTDGYGLTIFFHPNFAEGDTAHTELNESVNYGMGLIEINQTPDTLSYLIEAVGAKRSSGISSMGTVTLAGNLGSGTVAATGAVGSGLTLKGGTSGGTNGTKIVASTHSLGLGRAIILAWDTEHTTSTALANLYLTAVQWASPTTASELVEGGAAHATVTPTAASTTGPFVVPLTLASGLSVVAVHPMLATTSPPAWGGFTIATGQSKIFDAVVQMPDSTGTWSVATALNDDPSIGGATEATASMNLSVSRTRDQINSDLISALNALSLTTTADKNHRSAATDTLDQLHDPKPIPDIIDGMMYVITNTAAIVGADTSAIRIDEARLLRSWERRSQP